MSDSTGDSPPREGGAFQEGEGSDFSELPPPESSDGGFPPRLNPLEITIWVSRFRERTFAWLDEALSRKTDGEDPFYLKTVLPVMDRLAGIGAGLIAMILCGATVLSNDGVGWGAGDSILYLLLGPTILIQNINALRLAMLYGTGRHNPAAGLRIRRRVVFLVATLVLYLENKRLKVACKKK